MNKIISLEEMAILIREKLEMGGDVEFTPKGRSMLPMLHDNVDVVKLVKPKGPLKKYDLPLYERENGKYVLHRVIKVCKDGTYIMRGDNRLIKEMNIRDENVIGVVSEFTRKGKHYRCTDIGYKIYVRVWLAIHPGLIVYKVTRRFAGRCKRKLLRMINNNR